jgi:hypothetical protein
MNKHLTMYNEDQHSESARDEDIKSSHRLRLGTRIGIVFLLLIAVITLTSLPALSKDKPRAPQKARAIKGTKDDTKKDLRGNVRKVESNRKLKEQIRSLQKSLELYK